MKNLVYFFLVVSVTMGSCKKETQQQDPCDGIICLNGGICVNGVCVCDTGYSGTQCEIYDACYNVQCGAHGHCVNGICQCDPGWTAAGCSSEVVPIYSFIGTYHMVGYSAGYGQTSQQTVLIDTVLVATKLNDLTLNFHLGSLVYTNNNSDSLYWFVGYMGSNYFTLTFKKPFDNDSAFYHSHIGGMGSGTDT